MQDIQQGTTASGTTLNITYNSTETVDFSYDATGQVSKIELNNSKTYSNGVSESSNTITINEYNAEGFLLTRDIEFRNILTGNALIKNTYRYTYENGKLVRTDAKESLTEFNMTYEYDAAGKLVKFNNSFGSSTEVIYNGNQISKTILKPGNGTEYITEFEFNSDGNVVKRTQPAGGGIQEFRYVYSGDNVVRLDIYYDNLPSFAYEYEYDDKKYPLAAVTGVPKGHPNIPSSFPESGPHNTTSTTYYSVSPPETTLIEGITIKLAYQYNSSGFPISANGTTNLADGTEKEQTTTSYSYVNCK